MNKDGKVCPRCSERTAFDQNGQRRKSRHRCSGRTRSAKFELHSVKWARTEMSTPLQWAHTIGQVGKNGKVDPAAAGAHDRASSICIRSNWQEPKSRPRRSGRSRSAMFDLHSVKLADAEKPTPLKRARTIRQVRSAFGQVGRDGEVDPAAGGAYDLRPTWQRRKSRAAADPDDRPSLICIRSSWQGRKSRPRCSGRTRSNTIGQVSSSKTLVASEAC